MSTAADDRAAITDLIYRYAELIDAGDFEGVGELLSRAAFGGPRTPTVSGATDIAAVFTATTRRFANGTPKTRHLVLNVIVEIAGDSATARSTFCVVQATDRIVPKPFLSDDQASADFLRIPADSPLANSGAGGDLPAYIGALPPGKAQDDDWFARLREKVKRD